VINPVSEKYDRLSPTKQTKTLIREYMHHPRIFGGGFRIHDHVRERRVTRPYEAYGMRTTRFSHRTRSPISRKSGGGRAQPLKGLIYGLKEGEPMRDLEPRRDSFNQSVISTGGRG